MSYDLTAKQLYEKGVSLREKYIETARDSSQVTIPYLYPDTDHEEGETFDQPYQSLGARGVNNLASRLLNVLFPTNQPFFRLSADVDLENEDPGLAVQVDEVLQKIEKTIHKTIDKKALRSSLYNALRFLIVGGTVVISNLDDTFRVLRLNQFVIKRKADKSLDYCIIKDKISREKAEELAPSVVEDNEKKEYYLYTTQYYEEDGVKICQEIEDVKVLEERFKKPQVFVVTSNLVDEEDYGRSIVEELLGDLYTLERLSEAVSQSAAIASKHIFLVDPGGSCRGRDLAKASNGDVISGRATDVTVLQSQKSADLGVVFNHIQELKDRLGKAFLLTAETFPDRAITATEARARVSEIEASLGGVYSQLSQTLQLPFLDLIIQSLEEEGKIQELPDGVSVNIITGMDLLDRKSKVGQIQEFLQLIAGLGPQALSFVNPVAIVKEIAKGIGLDVETFVVDPSEQQDMGAAMQQTQNNLMRGVTDGATQGVSAGMQGAIGQVTAEQAAQAFRG